MNKNRQIVSIVASLIASQSIVHAAESITYNFDDGTVQGWANNVPAGASGEDYVALDTSLNSYSGRTVARSADFMILEADYDIRDGGDTLVKVFSSPELPLTASSVISVWTLGGTGAVATPTWSNYADLPSVATSSGFMGIALRRVSDGQYLLFDRRSASGQSNRTVNWLELGWDSVEIGGAISGDAVGETYQIDLIDTFADGWGWIGIDDVQVDGLPSSDLAITHIDYDPTGGTGGQGEFTLTWKSREGADYSIDYTSDLVDWGANLDDAYPADAGDSTTIVFDHPDVGVEEIFFRIEEN